MCCSSDWRLISITCGGSELFLFPVWQETLKTEYRASNINIIMSRIQQPEIIINKLSHFDGISLAKLIPSQPPSSESPSLYCFRQQLEGGHRASLYESLDVFLNMFCTQCGEELRYNFHTLRSLSFCLILYMKSWVEGLRGGKKAVVFFSSDNRWLSRTLLFISLMELTNLVPVFIGSHDILCLSNGHLMKLESWAFVPYLTL